MMQETPTIATRLSTIKQRIADCEQQFGRKKGSVLLLAVSKNQSIEKIKAAYQAGQRLFGENYLQEALTKIHALAEAQIEWHFIGPIQSNKTRKIAEHFAWVHTVDQFKIAERLNKQRPAHLPPLNICIQVNIENESTKAGVKIEEILTLAQYCQTLTKLNLRGLMAIPIPQKTFHEQRIAFQKLFSVWQMLREKNFSLDTLSMGMSGDFAAAIAEGSTLVRMGTAIFGERMSL